MKKPQAKGTRSKVPSKAKPLVWSRWAVVTRQGSLVAITEFKSAGHALSQRLGGELRCVTIAAAGRGKK